MSQPCIETNHDLDLGMSYARNHQGNSVVVSRPEVALDLPRTALEFSQLYVDELIPIRLCQYYDNSVSIVRHAQSTARSSTMRIKVAL